MEKGERVLWWGFICAALLALFGLLYSVAPAHAQDEPVTICQQTTAAGIAFVFSPVPDNWLADQGWYYVGDDATLDDHTLTVVGLQFDNGYAYAIAGAADYSDSLTAYSDTTPPCSANSPAPTSTPLAPENALNANVVGNRAPLAPVLSSGRTCVIHYPQIVLVCSG